MARVHKEVEEAAAIEAPVLIRGQTGTGKELVAHAVHRASARRDGPFVAINMATVQPSTAHSTLFGHKRGSFTGAEADRDGCFARADGGTLFLDEIGETPVDVQPMLLRALETGTFQPLGASEDAHADVRLIAATDADLLRISEQGGFRAALLHRLAGFEIRVPPLSERREDIARLFVHFLGDEALLAPRSPEEPMWFSAEAAARLILYSWLGNVRELRNAARRLAVSARDRPLTAAAIERELGLPAVAVAPAALGAATRSPEKRKFRRKALTVTEDELEEALRACGWRFEKAANMLGISRTALYGLIDASPRFRKAKDIGREELLKAREDAAGDLERMSEMLSISKAGLRLWMKELLG
jgi:two-component system nitrogen regulation response regulator GlnG